MRKKNDKDESKNHEFFVFLFFYITQKIPRFRGFLQHVLYQIGIRCLVATRLIMIKMNLYLLFLY